VIVGGHLAAAFDWRVTLMIFAFAGAALSPLAVLMPEPARGARVAGTDGYASTIQRFLGIRTLVLHYAATVFVMFALQGYAVWMPSILERHRGFGLEEIANLAGAATLAGGVVGGILGGFLADWLYSRDRRGRLAVQTGAALLAAPCMLLSVLAHGRIPIIAGLFASMILLVVMFPILSAVIVDLVDAGDRGKAMAILLLAQTGLGFSLGPLVVGWVSDSTGSLLLGLAAPPAALVMVVVLGALGLGSVRRDVEAREARARP
jgi:MFS family permease